MDKRICQICGEQRPRAMETHHIIPRRYGGSDDVENLVTLCSSCHQAVESIYSNDRWESVGLSNQNPATTPAPSPDNMGKELLFNLVEMLREVMNYSDVSGDAYRFVHLDTSIPTELRINLRNSIDAISDHKEQIENDYELFSRSVYYNIAKKEVEKSDIILDTSAKTEMETGAKRCIAFEYEKLQKKLDLDEVRKTVS